ncbi:MAG TPA: hypothetical protein VG365_03460 [Solirubrobacteraceae bacterium]|jgi:uncharacterized protein YukE|nr:hypothetical protein [Solirubrobacteraceae bacterium]
MSDPLSDPRAADLLSADPVEVWGIAGIFRQVGREADSIAGALRRATHDPTWQGAAADAFRSTVGQLPGELDKVHGSYADVAAALDSYEGELATLKASFERVAQQLGAARSTVGSAQGQLAVAQSNLTGALAAPHAKPTSPPVLSAHDAVEAATGAVSRMQAEVSGLESHGMALLGQFQGARDHCQAKVSSACSLAPHQSWWDHLMSDAGNWMSDAGHFFTAIGKGIWNGVTGLPGALVDFVEHPSWKTFAKLAEDVAITASVVLLVTGVGEWLLPEEGLLAAGFSAANGAADAVATGASLDAAGAYGGQAAADALHGNYAAAEGDLAHGGLDLLTTLPGALGAPELGDVLPSARAADTAEEDAGVLKAFEQSRAAGYTPARSLLSLSSEQRSLVLEEAGLKSGKLSDLSPSEQAKLLQNLRNPAQMAGNAEQIAKVLHIKALPLKTAIDSGFDKVVTEPLQSYDQHRIDKLLGISEAG